MLGTPIVNRGARYSGAFAGQNPASRSSGSDSDSGSSIFITQHPVRPRRQRRSGRTNDKESDKKKEKRIKLPAATFHHLQEGKPTTLELNKSQNTHYHNALMGGFFYSVRELQACQTTDLLSTLPTVDQEGDFIAPVSEEEGQLEEEDIKVKKKDLVVFSKTKRPQPWYIPPRATPQSGTASETSRERLGGASHSGSRNRDSPGIRKMGNNQTRIQAEASKTTENRVFRPEESQDKSASDSDATFCELLEHDAQNDGGASTAGARLQADEQEEAEAQVNDCKSKKKKSDDLNLTLDETVQAGESGTCLETSDIRIKKKKKKKRHQSESEETYINGSCSIDAISLPASQESMVEKESLDGGTASTAEGAEDKDTQLVTKKKKRKKKRQLSLNLCSDTLHQSDESVSVQKTDETIQTSSFPAADAGTSATESAEISKRNKVGKKQKKRKLEAANGDGKPSETLQTGETKRKKQQEQSAETLAGVSGPDADAGYDQTNEDRVMKKKKKKKKDTGGVPPAAGQHIQSVLVSCSSLPHENTGLTVNERDASPSTHTSNAPKKRRKRKRENPQKVDQNSIDSEIEATERERTKVAAGLSEIPAAVQKSSHDVSNRKNKRTLHNPSEDFLTDW